jgi:hypothetical protein
MSAIGRPSTRRHSRRHQPGGRPAVARLPGQHRARLATTRPCPLHGSTAGTSRCFSANLEQHTFHCFKCGRSGNALDLWAQANRQSLYDAALDLCQRLNIPVPILPPHREEEPVAVPSSTCTMESN